MNFYYRILVSYPGHAFSNRILSCVFAQRNFLCISALRPSSSSYNFFHVICPFSYTLSVPISYSKIVLLSLHPVVGLFSYIIHLLGGRISFFYFGIICFICITWPCRYLLSFFSFFTICLFISSILRSENPAFLAILLGGSARVWHIVLNHTEFAKISIDRFSLISLYRFALKISVKYIFVVFPHLFSRWCFCIEPLPKSLFVYLKLELPTFARCHLGP